MKFRSRFDRVLPILALSLTACGSSDGSLGPSVTVSDSAGIDIVTNHAPVWSEAEVWQVSDTPMVTIGELYGPSELVLGRVRAVGWLADGRIFLGDEQAHAIRTFSPQGEALKAVGGPGQGPGELNWFVTVSTYRHDSLFVYDYAEMAVSVFGPDLNFARRFHNPVLQGNYWVVSALDDGRFLLYSPGETRVTGGPGIVPDTSLILVSAPDGSAVDTIGAFQHTFRDVGPEGRLRALYLQPYATITAAGERILWTAGSTFQYTEADGDGTLRRIVRKPHEPVPVTAEIIQEFRREYLARVSPGRSEESVAQIRQRLEEARYHDSLPATSPDLKIDPDGNRWVGRYSFSGDVTTVWEVFDSTGVWLGTAETPSGLEIHQIGQDQIIGVATDEYDVPYVQIYRLYR